MHKIAIIFAGGTGQRMNTKTRPKQFLELNGKPIIVHTIEHFQHHPMIDGIVVACLKDWIMEFQRLKKLYCLNKVSAVIPGGENGQQSIYNGLLKAAELYTEDSLVLIHDGVRPLIDENTITKDIECVQRFGSAVTVSPAVETVAIRQENGEVGEIIDRKRCEMAKAPQCFYLKDILLAHEKAKEDGNLNFIDSASLMQHYGYDLHTVEGPMENIKITTPSDFYIFRALLNAKENSEIFGL